MSRYSNYKYTDSSKLKAHDFYPTPPWASLAAVRALWNNHVKSHLGFVYGKRLKVLDPGCGYGSLGEAWRKVDGFKTQLIGSDLVSDRMRRAFHLKHKPSGLYVYDEVYYKRDFLNAWLDFQTFNVVLSNPPFTYWTQFWDQSFAALADYGVLGMFAPLSYLQSSEKRGQRIWDWLEAVYIFGDRIDFKNQGSPNNQTMFVVFSKRKHHVEPPIRWLWKKDGRE